MTVIFACGHVVKIEDGISSAPVCHCGNQQIQGVQVRPPKFRGVATGPYCETVYLEPGIVNVASGKPLVIKEQTHG